MHKPPNAVYYLYSAVLPPKWTVIAHHSQTELSRTPDACAATLACLRIPCIVSMTSIHDHAVLQQALTRDLT